MRGERSITPQAVAKTSLGLTLGFRPAFKRWLSHRRSTPPGDAGPTPGWGNHGIVCGLLPES